MPQTMTPAHLFRLTCLALAWALVGCAGGVPQQASGCIHGDPGGSLACQALTYKQAR